MLCAAIVLSLTSSYDAGLDEYVYGGPRTHTQIETVVAKEIHVPTWFVLEEDKGEKGEKGEGESSGGRLSRSLALGSKYAKPRAAPRSNGRHDGESSDELTDDEVYLARHRPYEEQEVRFRYLLEPSALQAVCGCDGSCRLVFILSCLAPPTSVMRDERPHKDRKSGCARLRLFCLAHDVHVCLFSVLSCVMGCAVTPSSRNAPRITRRL